MNLYPVAVAMTKHESSGLAITSLIMLIEAVSSDEAKGKAFDMARKEQGPDWTVASLAVLDTPLQRVATVHTLTVRWQDQEGTVLSGLVTGGTTTNVKTYRWLRRVRRNVEGEWYVQRKSPSGGWEAMDTMRDWPTIDEAKAAAEASVRPEELA